MHTMRWLKIVAVVIGIVAGLVALGVAIAGWCESNANRRNIQAIQRINENLVQATQQQKIASQRQLEAQRQQDANWQNHLETLRQENAALQSRLQTQERELGTLKKQQADYTQALTSAQASGALRQVILIQKTAIRDLWAAVEKKELYFDPAQPPGPLDNIQMPMMKPEELKDSERRATLRDKEIKLNEVLALAKSRGLIEEMPPATGEQFKHNLDTHPVRPIYHFVGEKTWWTTFQDFGELPVVAP